jgi:hypothetical protein
MLCCAALTWVELSPHIHQHCLPACIVYRAAHVPTVFSPLFLRALLKNLSKQEHYLHGAAKQVLEHIGTVGVSADTEMRIAMAVALQRQRVSAGVGRLIRATTNELLMVCWGGGVS